MFERTLSFLGYQFAKLQFRAEIDTVQSFTEFLRSAQNILIALPVGYDESVLAGNALRSFRNQLHHHHLTVIHNSTRTTPFADFPRCEIVRMDPSDLNRFFLPTRSFLQRIMTHPYDVAVDLNLDFVLHTAYICRVSRAKARVGFAHSAADDFYNVQINLISQRSPQALYEKFAECLAMF